MSEIKEFKTIIELARNMKTVSATRGGLVQLDGKKAYLVNEKNTILLKILSPENLGSGTFYSHEAPVIAERVSLRDDTVLFEWKEKGRRKRIFIPNKKDIKQLANGAIHDLFNKPQIKIPLSFFDELNEKILNTRLSIVNGNLSIKQTMADGSVSIETELSIKSAFASAEIKDTAEVICFTRDLLSLKPFLTNLTMDFKKESPISITGKFTNNLKFRGLISHQIYEL